MSAARTRRPPVAPRRAVVLAAGFGTRMLPLSRVVPKALVPLWGVPVIEHVIRMLTRWGVKEILVNCHHRADAIVEFVRKRPQHDVRLTLSYEPEILGTAGVLRRADWYLDDRPFWMLNADVAADLDPSPILHAAARRNTMASLWMIPDRGPRSVDVQRGRVVRFRSSTPGNVGTFTFSGLHLLSPRILPYIPEGFSSIVTAYEAAMEDGYTVRGVEVPDSYWADMGTPEQVVQAHRDIAARYRERGPGCSLMDPALLARERELRRDGCRIEGFAAVDPHAKVHPRSALCDAVVMGSATVARGASLRRGILGPAALLRGAAERLVLRADDALDAAEIRMAERALGPVATTTAESLPQRGSARTFTRLRRGTRSAILIRYSTEREENALYAPHARLLRRERIPVPRVLGHDAGRCVTLMEDVGTRSLQHLVGRSRPHRIRQMYVRVLDHVYRLHRRGARAVERERTHLMRPFGPSLYRSERELFRRYALPAGVVDSPTETEQILRDLTAVGRQLGRFDPVLLHRDLQSSNIYFPAGEPILIDFQGMRLGPAAYDIASLLCDPYVSLPEDTQRYLLAQYAGKDQRAAHDMQVFWCASIQRLAQALGAFGRLSRLPGGAPFAEYVRPALLMMQRSLREADLPLPALSTYVNRRLHR